MLKYILILLSLYSLCAYANPRGFNEHKEQLTAQQPRGFNLMQSANTVHGIKDQAQDGDYVLLPGYFKEQISATNYIFCDVLDNPIEINLQNAPKFDISFNGYYFIWGKVNKSFFNTSVNVEYISTPRFESRLNEEEKEIRRQMLKERLDNISRHHN